MIPLIVPPCPKCGNRTEFHRIGQVVVCLVCAYARVAQ